MDGCRGTTTKRLTHKGQSKPHLWVLIYGMLAGEPLMPRRAVAVPLLFVLSSTIPSFRAADSTNAGSGTQVHADRQALSEPVLHRVPQRQYTGRAVRPAGVPQLTSVVHDYPHWALVLDRLNAREMPPKQVPQPPEEARQAVIDWVQAVRHERGARRTTAIPVRCWCAA